jgi:hypothetical protein
MVPVVDGEKTWPPPYPACSFEPGRGQKLKPPELVRYIRKRVGDAAELLALCWSFALRCTREGKCTGGGVHAMSHSSGHSVRVDLDLNFIDCLLLFSP